MSVVLDMALTAVMVVTPTAMYVALWRGLERLQDDDLVTRIDTRLGGELDDPGPDRPAVAGLPALETADLDPELDAALVGRIERRESEGETDADGRRERGRGETRRRRDREREVTERVRQLAEANGVTLCPECGAPMEEGSCPRCARE
jgi:chorismate mutase